MKIFAATTLEWVAIEDIDDDCGLPRCMGTAYGMKLIWKMCLFQVKDQYHISKNGILETFQVESCYAHIQYAYNLFSCLWGTTYDKKMDAM